MPSMAMGGRSAMASEGVDVARLLQPRHVLDVAPRAEGAPRTGDHHHPPARCAQCGEQVLAHRAGERVELVGTVEGDGGDGVGGSAVDHRGDSILSEAKDRVLKRMKRAAQLVLYATIPVAVALQFMHASLVWEFVFACAAVLPLAAWIGVSTEQLAPRMGATCGALFNGTFGNFAEMIIAIFGMRAGLPDVVRASLSGSILGNLLFVTGASMVAGGWRRTSQKFNA